MIAGVARRRVRAIGAGALVALVLGAVVFGIWVSTPMTATLSGVLRTERDAGIRLSESHDRIVMEPTSGRTRAGLVFYPGARVDPYAYLATLRGLVDHGTTVVIVEVPLHLAFADRRSVEELTSGIDGVDRWYLGGHSLGGVRACQLADQPLVAGLVLLGSYCANDLSATALPVLSVAGSDDGLSGPSVVKEHAAELPSRTTFVTIEGSNHARFGDYGDQPGDGTATISRARSTAELTRALTRFVQKDSGLQ